MRLSSRVVVGSPTARVAAFGAATVLITLLATGALVIGAQSPSPAPVVDSPVPEAPTAFTGVWCIGPPVALDRGGSFDTVDTIDGNQLTRYRRGAWKNAVVMSDPRLQGDAFQTYETDTYHPSTTSQGPGLIAASLSIVNDSGSWVSRGELRGMLADGTETTNVFVGRGGYEGLIAIMQPDGATVPRPEGMSPAFGPCQESDGFIFASAPVIEPYLPE